MARNPRLKCIWVLVDDDEPPPAPKAAGEAPPEQPPKPSEPSERHDLRAWGAISPVGVMITLQLGAISLMVTILILIAIRHS